MTSDDLETLPGVGPATADKLKDAGYDTFQGIAVASPGELEQQADLGEATAQKAIRGARDEADIGGFESGLSVLERRKEIGDITTGAKAVDDLLGGGVETQTITEAFGEYGVGKSQLTQQLSVNVQLPPEAGGLGGSAIFIDSEDTFRPQRIIEMVQGLSEEQLVALGESFDLEVDPNDGDSVKSVANQVLENIQVAKAHNTNHQIMLAEKALETANEKREAERPPRLLVIDSLTAHFRAEYVGRGELAERQQKLNKHLHDLERFGNLHNAAVVVTNQVQSNPDSMFGDPTKPIGGNVLGHSADVRVYLRKSKKTKRVARLVDAPDLPDGEAIMRVETDGIVPE